MEENLITKSTQPTSKDLEYQVDKYICKTYADKQKTLARVISHIPHSLSVSLCKPYTSAIPEIQKQVAAIDID